MVDTEGGGGTYRGGGGVSGPSTPPAPAAAAGETYSQTPLGKGNFRITAASIHTTNAYEEQARISLIYVDSNASETEQCLESGLVSYRRPFSLATDRIVSGPGFIRAYVVNLDATTFAFKVVVDKIEESKEITRGKGRFGTWF